MFGPTFQGEGPQQGRYAHFLRLGLCNLNCVWCDTPYTWDWQRFDRKAELGDWSVEGLVSWCQREQVRLLVITGGEPLVQRRELGRFVEALHGYDYPQGIGVETNGTIAPSAELYNAVDYWNVSPKLAHSGCDDMRYQPNVIKLFAWHPGVAFKYVVQRVSDFDELDWQVADCGISRQQVWVMAEGTTSTQFHSSLRALASAALERRYNLTGRLHIELWGDVRGH